MRKKIIVLCQWVLAALFTASIAAAQPPAWWTPVPGTTWQWQLSGTVDTSFDVDMYDIDLFETPQETIDALHLDGRVVICYFSAGSFENYRPDKASFPPEVKGKKLDGWPGERWLDIRNLAVLGPIMEARLDLAVSKNCDGVEPDNIDGYLNETGFPLDYDDQLTYNVWLAAEAHARGLSIGLKNDLDQIPDLVDDFDWMLNEQCYQYEECDTLLPFVAAGKAVFGVEYLEEAGSPLTYCPAALASGFSWLVKTYDLGAIPPQSCADYVPVILTSPVPDALMGTRPVVVWEEHGAAAQYRVTIVRVFNGSVYNSGWLGEGAVCTAGVCQYAPGTLKRGAHTIKIKARWPGTVAKPNTGKVRFKVT